MSGTLGNVASKSTGAGAGNIPVVPFTVDCMDMSMPAPFRLTGTVLSIDPAGTLLPGLLTADQFNTLVLTSGGYSNPSWITGLAYSKLTGTPSLGTASAQNTTFFDLAGAAAEAQAASQPLAAILTNLAALSGTSGFPRKTAAATWSLDTSAYLTGNQTITISGDGSGSGATAISLTLATVASAGTYSGVTIDVKGRVTTGTTRSFNNAPGRTIQTVAAAANGWQISSTRDSEVTYSCSITTTSTIGGPQEGNIVLEICSTNSAVAASWTEIDRITNSQTITLAIVLQSVQKQACSVHGFVPAGYFVRTRSISTSGSPVFASNSGQETIL